jgi:hypothetical protein
MEGGGRPTGFGAAAVSLADPRCVPGQEAAAKAANAAILEQYETIKQEHQKNKVSTHWLFQQHLAS